MPFWKKKAPAPDPYAPQLEVAPPAEPSPATTATSSTIPSDLRVRCPGCGKAFEMSTGSCPKCHRALTPAEVEKFARVRARMEGFARARPQFVRGRSKPASVEVVRQDGRWVDRCISCGATFEVGQQKCPKCGAAAPPVDPAKLEAALSPFTGSAVPGDGALTMRSASMTNVRFVRRNGALLAKCPGCQGEFDPHLPKCPQCGHAMPPGTARLLQMAEDQVAAFRAQQQGDRPLPP